MDGNRGIKRQIVYRRPREIPSSRPRLRLLRHAATTPADHGMRPNRAAIAFEAMLAQKTYPICLFEGSNVGEERAIVTQKLPIEITEFRHCPPPGATSGALGIASAFAAR